ncbi:MAG: sulfatase/phosphatase domain-containing protein, partial [Rufibacter sp.]
HFGVRTQQHKLIYYYTLKEWEFFDLKKDPQEMRSEYQNPAYAATIKKMKEHLRSLQARYKDPVAKVVSI